MTIRSKWPGLNPGFEGLYFIYRPGQLRILSGQSGVSFRQVGLHPGQLLGVAVGNGTVLLRDFGDVEERFANGRRIWGIAAGQPVEDVEEFFESVEGITVADRFVAVDGQVADFLDGEDLGEEAGFQVLPEGRFVDQCGQVVGVGLPEVGVIGIEPLHRPLQRAPGIETTGPRGAVDVLLGFAGYLTQLGPVGVEEGEIGHYPSGISLKKAIDANDKLPAGGLS